MDRQRNGLAFWTMVYVSSVACQDCRWMYTGNGGDAAARAAGRRHARKTGHAVCVESGRTTVYGETTPGVRAR